MVDDYAFAALQYARSALAADAPDLSQSGQALRPTGPRQASRRQRGAAERGGGSQAPADATRYRVLALVSRFFNLFETWEWRPQHTNPVRVSLDSGEQAALSAALDRLDERHPASLAAIRVAALTGLRISEVCSIR